MTYQLLQGNSVTVLRGLLAGSVQMCITSPPYYGLRDYGTARWGGGDEVCDHKEVRGGNGNASKKQTTSEGTQAYQYRDVCARCGAVRIDEQIGLENTPEQYVENLVAVFREVWRVLKNNGTLWVNLGDSYNGRGGPGGWADNKQTESFKGAFKKYDNPNRKVVGLKPKDLIMIPASVAIALRADGWYLRSDIVWSKPNPMPESVTDRPTKSHEYIFLLSKSDRYYYNAEAIAEPGVGTEYDKTRRPKNRMANARYLASTGKKFVGASLGNGSETRNKRTVWTVPTGSSDEDHYASYPIELIEPCVLAGSAVGDTVLDPFSGTATTGAAALKHGRNYIGIDLNPEYIEISNRRLMAAMPIPVTKVDKAGVVQLGFGQILNEHTT